VSIRDVPVLYPPSRQIVATHIDVPSGPLARSLTILEQQTGLPIACDVPLAQKKFRVPRVKGNLTIPEALRRMLVGTDWAFGEVSEPDPKTHEERLFGIVLCQNPVHVHIDAGDAAPQLNEFSRQSGLQLLFDFKVVKRYRTHAVDGVFYSCEALRAMLADTDLQFEYVNPKTLAITLKPVSLTARLRKWFQRPAPAADGLEEVLIASTQNRDATLLGVGAPLQTLSRADIDNTGLTNIPDLLQTLPQVFGGGPTDHTILGREAGTNSGFATGVNLRGLDAGATLVLLDGRRLAGSGTAAEYTDITNIPLSAIDHIDIVADGSSTRYGADAVAGVVNFVTRRNFTGIETQASGGQGSGGALDERGFSQLFGHSWESGRGMVAFEYDQRDTLPAADRSLATSNLVPFGGDNFDQPYGSPGTIVVGSQTWAIPQGRPFTVSALQPGTQNLYDQYSGVDVLPSRKVLSLTGHIDQSLGDRAEVWFDTWLSTRESMEIVAPGAPATLTILPNNPYYMNPTGGTGPVEILARAVLSIYGSQYPLRAREARGVAVDPPS